MLKFNEKTYKTIFPISTTLGGLSRSYTIGRVPYGQYTSVSPFSYRSIEIYS